MSRGRFSRETAVGELALQPVDPDGDAAVIHGWVTHPKCAFWLMQDHSVANVRDEFAALAASPHCTALLGLHDGVPAFLVERYDPAHVELVGLYPHRDGDVGMHFLCAPTQAPRHGFTLAVITTVMEMLFAEPDTRRVVVEPDVRNTSVHALNRAVGFQVMDTVTKPEKEALLSICTRDRFLAACGGDR